MIDGVNIPNLAGYISVKEAATLLGIVFCKIKVGQWDK
jgi:hypothetical protein